VKKEQEIQHVIGFSVSDVEELPIGPARYIRIFRIRTLLGDEIVLTLRSESRLGLTLEAEREGPVVPRQRLRRRKDDRRSESS
jgi:hypothetical protein